MLNKSVIAVALLASVEPIECEMARWVTKPPTVNFEAEGFGPGGQVVPLERQELGTEPLKSSQLENVGAFERTRGLHYKPGIKSSASSQNLTFCRTNSFNFVDLAPFKNKAAQCLMQKTN